MDLIDEVVKVAADKDDGILLSTGDEIIANSLVSLATRGRFFTFMKGLVRIIPEKIKLRLWERMMRNAPDKKDYAGKDIYMMNINANPEKGRAYEELFSDVLTFTRANDISMDIIGKGISKATGIQHMMSLLDVERENTFAFGDGLNDIEMLQYVGTGVAMANGYDALKEIADHVTDSVFNHGIAKGLKALELI